MRFHNKPWLKFFGPMLVGLRRNCNPQRSRSCPHLVQVKTLLSGAFNPFGSENPKLRRAAALQSRTAQRRDSVLLEAAGELGLFGGTERDVVFCIVKQFVARWAKVDGDERRRFKKADARGVGVGGPRAARGDGLFGEGAVCEAAFFPFLMAACEAMLVAVY